MPQQLLDARKSAPASSKCVAKLCRNLCGASIRFDPPEERYFFNRICTVRGVKRRRLPRSRRKNRLRPHHRFRPQLPISPNRFQRRRANRCSSVPFSPFPAPARPVRPNQYPPRTTGKAHSPAIRTNKSLPRSPHPENKDSRPLRHFSAARRNSEPGASKKSAIVQPSKTGKPFLRFRQRKILNRRNVRQTIANQKLIKRPQSRKSQLNRRPAQMPAPQKPKKVPKIISTQRVPIRLRPPLRPKPRPQTPSMPADNSVAYKSKHPYPSPNGGETPQSAHLEQFRHAFPPSTCR